jgi:hypothetical protein
MEATSQLPWLVAWVLLVSGNLAAQNAQNQDQASSLPAGQVARDQDSIDAVCAKLSREYLDRLPALIALYRDALVAQIFRL